MKGKEEDNEWTKIVDKIIKTTEKINKQQFLELIKWSQTLAKQKQHKRFLKYLYETFKKAIKKDNIVNIGKKFLLILDEVLETQRKNQNQNGYKINLSQSIIEYYKFIFSLIFEYKQFELLNDFKIYRLLWAGVITDQSFYGLRTFDLNAAISDNQRIKKRFSKKNMSEQQIAKYMNTTPLTELQIKKYNNQKQEKLKAIQEEKKQIQKMQQKKNKLDNADNEKQTQNHQIKNIYPQQRKQDPRFITHHQKIDHFIPKTEIYQDRNRYKSPPPMPIPPTYPYQNHPLSNNPPIYNNQNYNRPPPVPHPAYPYQMHNPHNPHMPQLPPPHLQYPPHRIPPHMAPTHLNPSYVNHPQYNPHMNQKKDNNFYNNGIKPPNFNINHQQQFYQKQSNIQPPPYPQNYPNKFQTNQQNNYFYQQPRFNLIQTKNPLFYQNLKRQNELDYNKQLQKDQEQSDSSSSYSFSSNDSSNKNMTKQQLQQKKQIKKVSSIIKKLRKKTYQCRVCGIRFLTIFSFNKHKKQHFQQSYRLFAQKQSLSIGGEIKQTKRTFMIKQKWISQNIDQNQSIKHQIALNQITNKQNDYKCIFCQQKFNITWCILLQEWALEKAIKINRLSQNGLCHFNCYLALQNQTENKKQLKLLQ